jgi:hypothetical protein
MFGGRSTVENERFCVKKTFFVRTVRGLDIARGVGVGVLSEMDVRVEEQF